MQDRTELLKDYPPKMLPASDATLKAYAALMAQAAKRPNVSETTMDRYRVRWQLSRLADAGVVTKYYRSNGRHLLTTHDTSERAYRTTRELEAFCHGALAVLAVKS